MNIEELGNMSSLSPAEKELALKILKEYADGGYSDTYDALVTADYKEQPVDIITFIKDYKYLGKAWHLADGTCKLFPFWESKLIELFPDEYSTNYNNFIESGARGLGKAQPLYSKILTYKGFVNMGDIKIGDLVYGDDGETHPVVAIFPQGKKKVYEVTFNDRSKTRCSDEHLWNVHRQGSHSGFKTLTLNDILKDGISRVDSRGITVSKYSIPMTKPINMPHKDVFIEPYLMGCLIGDGGLSRNYIKFTSKDEFIIEKLNESLNKNGYELKSLSDDYGYGLRRIKHKNSPNEYLQEIIKLDLNSTSENKFIPDVYKFNDINTRIEILQGLMDTDGYCDKEGYCTFTTISKRLADDVAYIVQSLGGTAPIRIRGGRGYKNKDGIKVNCDDAYEVSINLPTYLTPFKLPRKIERLNQTKKEPVRVIKEINYIGEEECQCILLDSESHLYLTDDLIVTHNSEIAITCGLYMMHRLMCLRNPHEYLNLKPTEKVAFAFMNITKILAEEIGISKFQATVQMSPWFMDRGTMTQKNNEPYWNPPDFINMIIGSQASHVIGQPIYFCLAGDTPIITENGIYPIQELENKDIKVFNISDNGDVVLSDTCTVKMTSESSEEYEIELEDGSIIKCTPNHRFMLKDGTYKEAQFLTEDDELMDVDNLGKIRSEEFKNHLSVATKGKKKLEGFGDKISKATKGRKNTWQRKPVLCIETNIIYESPIDAEQQLNICRQNIQRSCKSQYKAGGYHWRYVNEN